MKSLANIWRNLPLKAKIGVGLFGFFVLAGIIGPMVAPYDPSLQTPLTMAGAVRASTGSAPRRKGRTSCPRC